MRKKENKKKIAKNCFRLKSRLLETGEYQSIQTLPVLSPNCSLSYKKKIKCVGGPVRRRWPKQKTEISLKNRKKSEKSKTSSLDP